MPGTTDSNPYVVDLHNLQRIVVPTGWLFHIPVNMVHTAVAGDDGDATYLVWRDRVAEKQGWPVTIEAPERRQ